MVTRRVERLNSLLKEVISEIIRKDVRNPRLPELITVTHVSITKDLHYAKVYVSIIGDELAKKEAISVLQTSAGFIAVHASKKVVMRYFPNLTFLLDDSVEKRMHIEELISKLPKKNDSLDEPGGLSE